MIGTILMPMLIDHFDGIAHGWTIMTAIIGIPLALIGSIRFLTIPEADAGQACGSDIEHTTLWETVKAFVSNKYTLMVMVMFLAVNVMNTFSVSPTTYYFKYVVGDISKQTVVSMMSIFCIVVLVFITPLVKRFGSAKVVQMGFLIATISYALRFFCGSNLLALAVTGFLGAAAVLPYSTLNNLMLIDCMDYGQWRTHKRQEAAIFAGASLGTTIGNGIGSSLSGFVLDLFGYDGNAAVQSASAVLGIRVCFSFLPALMMLIGFLILMFYDLEKKMPQIHTELEERKIGQKDTSI